MNKKNKYNNQQKKKGQGRALTITLLISGLIMTGLVTWLGLNEWNVDKSIKKFQEAIGVSTPVIEEPEEVPTKLPESAEDKKDTEEEQPTKNDVVDPAETEEKPNKTPDQQIAKPTEPAGKTESDAKNVPDSTVTLDNGGYIEGQTLPEKPTYVKNILVANKKYPLPATFAPGEDKAARAAFNKMAAEAALSGFNLTAFSTYRAFDYQTTLYDRYVARDGKTAADTYSARPGYSEHQTGLAFDIGEVNFEKHWASSSFGETEAGKWVAANAHRYGFVMRYPKGKEQITGYMHESWHFRYVGTEIADDIFKNNGTLEEYLGI